MKAIIPVAGMGTHLRPHTYTQPKPLIPVAGKPILGFIIDRLSAAGIDEFIFVIGYLGEKIEAYVSRAYPDLRAHFVDQHSREGLGHAIYLTMHVAEGEPVFIALGDTIFEANIEEVLSSSGNYLGLRKVSDPRNFGVAELDDEGKILKVEEKPDIPKSNMALVGLYKIDDTENLFRCLQILIDTKKQTQGEYHLTDALMAMIKDGSEFKSFKVQNWYDCGRREVLLDTNTILLKKQEDSIVEEGDFENTIIVPPVAIAPGAKIVDSIIGPYVTVGRNVNLNRSIIQESIIGDYAKIEDVVLEKSVIGGDASVQGMRRSLNIGDNTEIDFG